MAGKGGLRTGIESSSVSAESNEYWIHQSGNFCNRGLLAEMAFVCVRGERVVDYTVWAVWNNRDNCSREMVLQDGDLKPTL